MARKTVRKAATKTKTKTKSAVKRPAPARKRAASLERRSVGERPYLILSIDGGGIRGLIPAVVLTELEKELHRRMGHSVELWECFDLIAGTSTGGIIACGLACPHPERPGEAAMRADDLRALYRNRGKDIFPRGTYHTLRRALLRFNPLSLFDEKYDEDTLEDLLLGHLGETPISRSLTGFLMPSYDMRVRGTVFLKYLRDGRRNETGDPDYDDYPFWEAARATSAAPTYFQPAKVKVGQRRRESIPVPEDIRHTPLIDGGVFCNNPVLCAVVEAMKAGRKLEDIRVISLGTGEFTSSYNYSTVKGWGRLDWVSPALDIPLLNVMMHGQAHAAHHHVRELITEQYGAGRYYRFDCKLDDDDDTMDDASERNLRALEGYGQRIVDDMLSSGAMREVVTMIESRLAALDGEAMLGSRHG